MRLASIFRLLQKTSYSILIAAATLAGCAIGPKHPALTDAALPELIPVRDFVANRASSGSYKISPDGQKIAWMGTAGLSSSVLVKALGQDAFKAFKMRARSFVWSADSQYLVITADTGGDENTHIFAAPVAGDSATALDMTPFAGSLNYVTRTVEGSADVIIGSNRRDKKVFDLLRLNLATGAIQLVAQNPGNVGGWGLDRQGTLHARVALDGAQAQLQLPDPKSASGWATTAQWSRFDTVHLVDFLDNGIEALALSNRGRDKIAYVKVDLTTGLETLLFAVPTVDIDEVLIDKKTKALDLVYSMPDYPRQDTLNPRLKAKLEPLSGGKPMETYVSSISDDRQHMTVVTLTDQGSKSYLFTGDAAPVLLGESTVAKIGDKLANSLPISYPARDGLTLHGYLTRPVGVAAGKPLPMVLLVHGGPWARDRWVAGNTNRSIQQFFANRGYAVLQVNYRGSSGYGKAFMEKAVGEFAGKMHDDLIDGVQWAVATGVADAKKIAIYGASYGGYAALVGATFTPDTFACAVDVVGVSDLARLMETAPPYWELGLPWWKRYVGEPSDPAQRKIMDAKSPVNFADKVKIPLLIMHGVNDPRVKLEQSEKMLTALQKAGKAVSYTTFKGDGHGNQKWSNNLTMYRQTEDFLAQCLGGRSNGLDFYELGAWAF